VRGAQVLLKLSKLACFALLAVMASAQTSPSAPLDLKTIIARMMAAQQHNKLQSRAYTVKRDYQLLDKTQVQKAQVVAHITYMPPDQKQYRIESSYGGLGEKILRDVLEKETAEPRDPDRKALSAANYNFELLGTEQLEGRNCYVLRLDPKRDDKELIRGQLWVDAETYNIHRIEGNPAKNPSWWIRDLHLLISFAEVDGMWLRTFTYAVANVRFKGKYEMVARDLEYNRAPEQVVRRFRRRARPGIVTGAALNP
jgi:outer membrane lipoprotein-sorting protein